MFNHSNQSYCEDRYCQDIRSWSLSARAYFEVQNLWNQFAKFAMFDDPSMVIGTLHALQLPSRWAGPSSREHVDLNLDVKPSYLWKLSYHTSLTIRKAAECKRRCSSFGWGWVDKQQGPLLQPWCFLSKQAWANTTTVCSRTGGTTTMKNDQGMLNTDDEQTIREKE